MKKLFIVMLVLGSMSVMAAETNNGEVRDSNSLTDLNGHVICNATGKAPTGGSSSASEEDANAESL